MILDLTILMLIFIICIVLIIKISPNIIKYTSEQFKI